MNLPDPETPVGARGIGEPPVAAGACAIMNAISAALGDDVFKRAPITLDNLLMALEHGRPMQEPSDSPHHEDGRGHAMALVHDVIPPFQLFQPGSIDDALDLLDARGAEAWVIAGGMDSFDWLKDRTKRTSAVVELSQVAELRGIRDAGGGLEIGAMTTLVEVAEHALVRERFGLLAEAAGLVASPQIRNQGTLGGNVSQDTRCWYYRRGWSCYRAGGNICYADSPTA